ncbi:MAG: SRPBCC family protein [Gaiellales bacterium]
MAAITHSIEIDRSPSDVFAYLDDLRRHGEWQPDIVEVQVTTPGPTQKGTRAVETRRIGGRNQTMTFEITEHDPPRVFAFRGMNGPVRPIGRGTVEPVGDGRRSRLTLDFDFEGHGIGKLIVIMARRQARSQIPQNQERLKGRLESAPAGTAQAPPPAPGAQA